MNILAVGAAFAIGSAFFIGRASSRSKAGVRHCVMGKFTAEATYVQKVAMITAVLGMRKSIKEILNIHAGLDAGLASGNHDFCVTVDFKSGDDYKIYATHASHVAVITDFIKPILAPGTRTAVQFAL